jgi:hypothetical protein
MKIHAGLGGSLLVAHAAFLSGCGASNRASDGDDGATNPDSSTSPDEGTMNSGSACPCSTRAASGSTRTA